MKHTLEISMMQEICSVIIRERNEESLLNKVLGILERRMGMLRGTFALRFGDTLSIEASHGAGEDEIKRGSYRMGEGVTGLVAESGKSLVIPDLRTDPRFLNRTGTHNYEYQVAYICVPLIHNSSVIGTLAIDRPVTRQTNLDQDVALLEIIAQLTAEAAAACISLHEERQALETENRCLHEQLQGNPGRFIGNSRGMQQVYMQLRQVAPSDATVLIRGSSGTGKELLARAIVSLSPRKDKPFVTLNCAALPENLVESELFGHEKGSFTGALARRVGRAEEADGGTLFLDEIGDLPLQAQVKLLRLLQERTFSRVGSNKELHADIRFIAATSRNLEELIEKKLFREDLFYRLNIFPISLPDLSARKGDIILLAEHFIERFNEKYGKNVRRLGQRAVRMLMSYSWPGNVRELENCMERAVLTAPDDCVHAFNLPPSLQMEPDAPQLPDLPAETLQDQLDIHERGIITRTLAEHGNNITRAGKSLGLSPRMMNYRMKRLGIPSPRRRGE
ncbi:MAG: sigma 54-interacting transcriptional regulator [Akkermansia sp.]|nr:sigma 54-interacting transcriptional regulator [Akkermansia sp.]